MGNNTMNQAHPTCSLMQRAPIMKRNAMFHKSVPTIVFQVSSGTIKADDRLRMEKNA